MNSNTDLRTHIHESNLIEGFDGEHYDTVSMLAWRDLLAATKITHRETQLTQFVITAHQDDLARKYRDCYRDATGYRVQVGGRECPAPSLVPALMDEWLHGPFLGDDPHAAHVAFEHIHPFADGNGRTGRMLMWYQEIRLGRTPTLIRYAERHAYYDWFSERTRRRER